MHSTTAIHPPYQALGPICSWLLELEHCTKHWKRREKRGNPTQPVGLAIVSVCKLIWAHCNALVRPPHKTKLLSSMLSLAAFADCWEKPGMNPKPFGAISPSGWRAPNGTKHSTPCSAMHQRQQQKAHRGVGLKAALPFSLLRLQRSKQHASQGSLSLCSCSMFDKLSTSQCNQNKHFALSFQCNKRKLRRNTTEIFFLFTLTPKSKRFLLDNKKKLHFS